MSRADRYGTLVALTVALAVWPGGGFAWGQTATTRAAGKPAPTTARAQEIALAAAAETVTASYEKVLKDNGIGIGVKGLRKYLVELRPTPARARRVKELIRQLGSDQWRLREAATKQLMAMPPLPSAALIAAAKSKDLERASRAKEILAKGEGRFTVILSAAFRVIAGREHAGMLKDVLLTIPMCESQYLIDAGRAAAEATAGKGDAAMLRRFLNNGHGGVRGVAVAALARSQGAEAADDVAGMLADSEDSVRLIAAIGLANMKDRRSLGGLVGLMASGDVIVRNDSWQVLTALTGKKIEFVPYGSEKRRAKNLAAWKAWLAKAGPTAGLHVPLKFRDEGNNLHGNTLIASGGSWVREFDPGGKVVFEYKTSNPWSAHKLRNGNYLITDYGSGKIMIVNAGGQTVWEYAVGKPLSARPLPNGNILIADYSGRRVLEVTRNKKVVWSYQAPWNCGDAVRLANGNTLVSGNGVQEIDPGGKVVWELKGKPFRHVFGVQRLPNGNTLLASQTNGRVYEVTRAKKIVWEYNHPGATRPYRLPNGNTLISGNQQAVEVTPAKRVVWSMNGISGGSTLK